MPFDPNLGPLGPLLGAWEGEKGTDLAPSDKPASDRRLVTSKYRERMVFEPTGRVDNHEQSLYGLRYSTKAWRIGSPDAFHEEVGYWMWDPASELRDEVFGICSSPFLTAEFKTMRYTLAINIFDDDAFHYEEHSWLKMKNRSELFDHKDENTLRRLRDL